MTTVPNATDPLAQAAAPAAPPTSSMTAGWTPPPRPTTLPPPAAEEVYDGPIEGEDTVPAAAAADATSDTNPPTAAEAAPAAAPAVGEPATTAPAAAAQQTTATPESTPAPPTPPQQGTAAPVAAAAAPYADVGATYAPSKELGELVGDYQARKTALQEKIKAGTFSVVDDGAEQAALTLLHQDITDRRLAERELFEHRRTERDAYNRRWADFERSNPHMTKQQACDLFAQQVTAVQQKYPQMDANAVQAIARDRWETLVEQGRGTKPKAAPAAAPKAAAAHAPKKSPTVDPRFMPATAGTPRQTPSDPLEEFASLAKDDAEVRETFMS